MGDQVPRVLDLFCGLGGATQEMRRRGWFVVGVDNVAPADVIADVSRLPIRGEFDLLWASPPCTYFTRSALPWYDDPPPSMALVEASVRAIEILRPRWWLIENVRGAVPWFKPLLGRWKYRLGAAFLWGTLPNVHARHVPPHKGGLSRRARAQCRELGVSQGHRSPRLRSKIPREISEAIADALADSIAGKGQLNLFGDIDG